jgi:hypothetical protein
MSGEKFELRNEHVKPKSSPPPVETIRGRQKVLWSGLELLPGQRDFVEESESAANENKSPN